jgi:hypothetical protein
MKEMHDMLRIPSIAVHDVFTLLDETHPLLTPRFPNIPILLQQPAKLSSLLHLPISHVCVSETSYSR